MPVHEQGQLVGHMFFMINFLKYMAVLFVFKQLNPCFSLAQVVMQGKGVCGNYFPEERPLFCIIHGQKRIELQGQVTAVVHQAAPEFTAFPPAVVSGISTEHQQHRNGKAQQGMHDRQVAHIVFI